jgi:hypothetical protein
MKTSGRRRDWHTSTLWHDHHAQPVRLSKTKPGRADPDDARTAGLHHLHHLSRANSHFFQAADVVHVPDKLLHATHFAARQVVDGDNDHDRAAACN